jgi:hypothetical protein
VYVFSHEISHGALKYAEAGPLGSLGGTIAQLREATGKGFSGIGNKQTYHREGISSQATEDMAELVNMYLIDPNYLERYLAFLQDHRHEAIRQKLGLITLDDPGLARAVSSMIQFGLHQDILK